MFVACSNSADSDATDDDSNETELIFEHGSDNAEGQ